MTTFLELLTHPSSTYHVHVWQAFHDIRQEYISYSQQSHYISTQHLHVRVLYLLFLPVNRLQYLMYTVVYNSLYIRVRNYKWRFFFLKVHCNKNPIYVFLFWELCGLTQSQYPNSCVCERFIYSKDLFTYFLQQNIGRSIVGMYKSFSDT